MIKVLFEFYELTFEIPSEEGNEATGVSVDSEKLNKVLNLALESSLKICPTELLDNEATKFVKNSEFEKFDLLTKSVDTLDIDKDDILTKSLYQHCSITFLKEIHQNLYNSISEENKEKMIQALDSPLLVSTCTLYPKN